MNAASLLDIGYLDLEKFDTIAAKMVRPEQHLNLVFFIVKNVVGNIRRYSNVPVWNNHTENIPIFWKYEQVRDLKACKIVH